MNGGGTPEEEDETPDPEALEEFKRRMKKSLGITE